LLTAQKELAMRFIFAFCLLFLCPSPIYSQDTAQVGRLRTAQAWLTTLGLPPEAQISDPISLEAYLDTWASADEHSNTQSSGETPILDLKSYQAVPTMGDRFLRALQFRTEIQQTPDYVYGVLEGAPAGTVGGYHANPDHGIFGYGGPIHFDELYVSSKSRTELCTAVTKSLGKTHMSPGDLKGKARGLQCDDKYLRSNRGIDKVARLASAVTLDIRVVQVPLFENGIVITADSPSRVKWTPTLTGSFDPSKFVRTPADTKALADYGLEHKSEFVGHVCGTSLPSSPPGPSKCVSAFALGGPLKRTLISVLPKVNVQVTTPFDLAKYGNTFVEPPNKNGRSLYNVTLNWDLHNAVPSADDRVAAINNLTNMVKPSAAPAEDKSQKIPDSAKRKRIEIYYLELANHPSASLDESFWRDFRKQILDF
jgi:hypothetical protein